MRITKLHIILVFIVAVLSGVYYLQMNQQKEMKLEREKQKQIMVQQLAREAKQKTEAEAKLKECLKNKNELAVEAVAVAGEYWLINKKEGKELEKGQATLKLAKESLAAGNHESAWRLARKSIEEFKAAPAAKLYYTVKRGDCLWRIAKMPQHYNNGSKWPRIWRANKKVIKNYRLIYPRQVFYIPK